MKPCRTCHFAPCACKRYSVDITLKCDIITARNREHLETIINNYLDTLAEQENKKITWPEVDWTISEVAR